MSRDKERVRSCPHPLVYLAALSQARKPARSVTYRCHGPPVVGFGYVHVNGVLNERTFTQKPSQGMKLRVARVPFHFFHDEEEVSYHTRS